MDDEEITNPKVDINRIRQKMGMVFQQFNLFPHLKIIDNITLAPVLLKKMTKEDKLDSMKIMYKSFSVEQV